MCPSFCPCLDSRLMLGEDDSLLVSVVNVVIVIITLQGR